MKRSGAGTVNIVAGLIVGLVVGLGVMYVLAPSLNGSTGSSTTNTGGSVSTTTATKVETVTSTAAGSGATTVTETTTVTGGGSTVVTTTQTVGAGATATITTTVTNIQTTTVSAVHGFYGGAVFVNIAPGTGSNLSMNYSPAKITVVIGVNNTVIWTNNDNTDHSVTADIVALFNDQDLKPGQSFGYTFTQVGTYRYTCAFHGYMIGMVIVKAPPT